MYIYSLIVILSLVLMLLNIISNNQALKKTFLFYISILIFIVVGFRTLEVGTDTLTYVRIYPYLAHTEVGLSDFFNSRFEIGYIWLNAILYQISEHYTLLLSTVAFFSLVPFFYIISKESEDYGLSLLIFIGTCFRLTMSSMRSMLAACLIFNAFYFLRYNKKIRSVSLVVIASFFHLSSLLMLPLIYFMKKWSRTVKVFLFCLSIPSVFIVQPILIFILGNSKYFTYLENATTLDWIIGGQKLSLILQFLIFLFVLMLGYFLTKNTSNDGWYYEQIIYIGTLIAFININVAIVSRITFYFFPFLTLYIPQIFEKIKNTQSKIIMKLLVGSMFIVYFYLILILRPSWTGISDYHNIFFE